MTSTALLRLPYIASNQNQKHISHNEALRMLDALVQLSVLDRDLSAPPDAPADGARYIVADGASGAWTGWDGSVAAYQDGAWVEFVPLAGWLAWLEDESKLLCYDGAGWSDFISTSLGAALAGGSFDRIGVNATADATNRLALSSSASLFNHAGNGHQIKVNKAAAGDTNSLLFQTNWSGRAEMGCAGNDDFSIKVSGDGSSWTEALRAQRDTGEVIAQAGINSGTAVIADDSVAVIDVASAGGLFFLWTADDPYPDASGGRYAMILFDIGNSISHNDLNVDPNHVDVVDNVVPDGTTGTDGNLGIFLNSRSIHLENRRNQTKKFKWLIMA